MRLPSHDLIACRRRVKTFLFRSVKKKRSTRSPQQAKPPTNVARETNVLTELVDAAAADSEFTISIEFFATKPTRRRARLMLPQGAMGRRQKEERVLGNGNEQKSKGVST